MLSVMFLIECCCRSRHTFTRCFHQHNCIPSRNDLEQFSRSIHGIHFWFI